MEKTRKKILIIDDEPLSARIARSILEKYYDVDHAPSGMKGLGRAILKKPDLVLLDVMMPELDGFETLKKFKEDPHISEIPVIFLTGSEDVASEIRGFEEGAEDFIKKPFVAKIMLQRIRHVLEMHELKFNLQAEVSRQMEKVMERQRDLEEFVEQTMLTLANTIDAKDRYTSGHSSRVAEYSREIARRAGKSADEQKKIYFMGLLHDIGKIGVPDDILNKPGKLTDAEYEAIKSHSMTGYRILRNMTAFRALAAGARWHHEKYDGSGYPDGLAGERIPEEARIIGVADSYDAMSSSRSYRKFLPQEKIRDELVRCSGTQFDPGYVKVMLSMIDDDKDYRMHEEKPPHLPGMDGAS